MTNKLEGKTNSAPPMNRHMRPPKPPKVKNMKATLSRIWGYMENQKMLFFAVVSFVIMSSVMTLIGPYVLGKAVDLLIEDFNQSVLWKMLALLVGIYIVQAVAEWFQNFWMIQIAQNTVYSMRKKLFGHLQLLPIAFFQKQQHGNLMSRLTNDMENVSRTLNSSIIQVATSVITLTGTLIIMLLLSPLLTVLTLTIVPAMFFGLKWITNRTGVYFKKQQSDLGEMNSFIEETLSGHKMIKIYSKEKQVIENFHHKNEALRESGYWAQTYSGFIPKLMNMLNNVSFTIIVGVGGVLALRDIISIGVIVTFTTYSRQFTRPLNDLANQFNTILSAVAGAERVFAIMDEEKEQGSPKEKHVSNLKGEVIFKNVSFSYDEGQNTLRNVHFHVEPGKTVALVGPTGAGKTTVISLLSRFYDPTEGEIRLDGQKLTEISRESLRNQIGIVLQDSVLFHATVMENIRYGKLEATDDEVIQAAKAANAHDFITKLPKGYETILHSDGHGISHGQRQLLSIARAMVAEPSLLILDEATSSIDTITEIKINEALATLMDGRTSFVIAHRLNTIQKADLILVLQKGQIIEQGGHEELLAQNGFYADLFHTQRRKKDASP
ncbi:ABC transporter ATP-binding protein [Salirhabdus sp. Marseille-P4669]|uniref:ABC transporter ATP-binding protein n=1 Tax=Salirhabdus sp. Marseille-P4669 TaxID=2042310 RepID=UPI000C7E7011